MKNPLDPVIVSATRTPIGKFRGALAPVRPDDLLALVYKSAIKKAGIDPVEIDEAFAGCANQAGEDNRNVARMAVLLAEFPDAIPAVTVNRLCASGLEAISQAARMIRLGDAKVVLAGGTESMSRAPWSMAKPEVAYPSGAPKIYDTALGWRFENPRLADRFPLESMGETAENVAAQFQISRPDQDAFALASHQKAVRAQQGGLLDSEITPVEIAQKKGASVIVKSDEGPRSDSTLEALSKLQPVFRQGGSVTAGNSSTLNDGAAALVLTSRQYANAHSLPILGSIRAAASAGVDPRFMGIGPVHATQKLFEKTGVKATDLHAVELNEAFAAQALACIRELGLDENIVNQHGGAIALGHPLGCSGARLIISLLNVLKQKNGTLGLASLCVGVGQGLSMLIERE